MQVTLRPYQEAGVTQLRYEYWQGRKSVLYCLPTGGGKTVVFSHIAESAARKGNRICILVHRQELVSQSSDSLTNIGVAHGVIAAGTPMDLSHSVQVASVQTLVRRLHLIPPNFFQLLVVDEAHHAVAGSWATVIQHYADAKVLGVTATPERLDGRGLGDIFDALVLGPDARWLTDSGFLAPARIFAPPADLDFSVMRRQMGDYRMDDAEEQVIRAKFIGDVVAHYRRHLEPGTAIAFCCSVRHAQAMADTFNAAGIRAASLDGKTHKDERKAMIAKLGTGEIQVLCSCQIISEGTDVPTVGGAILVRPTDSLSLYLQQVGRCLRPAPGKQHAIILDHVGNVQRFGLPTDPRDWSLEGRKRSRQDRDAAPPVKVCPTCFSVVSAAASNCDCCGHIFQPKVKQDITRSDINLVEITDIARADYNFSDRRRLVSQARTLEELERLAEEFGYKRGWAYKIYTSRQVRRYGT